MRGTKKKLLSLILVFSLMMSMAQTAAYGAANDVQITNSGGTLYYDANGKAVTASGIGNNGAVVALSKTIAGTSKENIFDITLQVSTTLTPSSQTAVTPDAAVVLTIDMSGTMETGKMGGKTRVEVAKDKARAFVEEYAASAGSDKSAKRMIAITQFNTYAKTLLTWVDVNTSAGKKAALNAINGIQVDMDEDDRCTNFEAATLLTNNIFEFGAGGVSVSSIPKNNRWAIFLSDGAPTVGIKDSEKSSQSVTQLNNDNTNGGGTNVSDVNDVWTYMSRLKNQANLFFVGVSEDMSKTFVDRDTGSSAWSSLTPSVNKSNETVGSWLGKLADATGGRYIPAADANELTNAFKNISNTIKTYVDTYYSKAWTAVDPMGTNIQFLGFYSDKDGLTSSSSIAQVKDGDTASLSGGTISWDLKKSNSTVKKGVYTYQIKYRVRLTNEAANFGHGTSYATNGTTTFQYQVLKNGQYQDGPLVKFPIPAVKGFLGTLSFTKVSSHNNSGLGSCSFQLAHSSGCSCGVNISTRTATSLDSGAVSFSGIPSGHTYTLTETKAAGGYNKNTSTSTVTVSYGTVSTSGSLIQSGKVINTPSDNPQTFTVKKSWTGTASVNEVTVYIYRVNSNGQNGALAATLKLNTGNGWSASAVLPTVDVSNGNPITYRAAEAEGDSYKLLKGGDFDGNRVAALNNVRTGTSNITIQKNWAAPSGLRPAVNIRLLQNGSAYGDYTLSGGNWSRTISVPLYDNAGNPYSYSVVELDGDTAKSNNSSITINGHTYDVTISGTSVTNKIQQEYTSVSGTKTWNVAGLSDEEKNALTAVITLYQNGTPYAEDTVTYADTSYGFTNLPKYTDDRSSEYTYTVAETAVSGNSSGTWITSVSGTNFTNTITDTVTISGTKTWVDPDESERPASITIKLMDGTAVAASKTISGIPTESGYTWEGVDLSYSFTVPKYDSQGAVIAYQIAEDTAGLYQPTYDGYNVTNTLNGGEKTISVQKIWIDDRSAHDDVTAAVYRTDTGEKAAEIALNQGDNWAGSAAVAKYEDGVELEYFVRELNEDGSMIEEGGRYGESYTVSYAQNGDSWTIKNRTDQEYVDVSGQKTWEGEGDRPDVTFTLYKNDVSTGQTRTQADLNPEDGNLFTFKNLEKYTFSGDTCMVNVYTIKETMSGTAELLARYGYDGTPVMGDADSNGIFQFVNTFTNGLTTVSGHKTWYGMGFSEEVKVGLFTGGVMIDSQTTSDLAYAFTDLTQYNPDGTLVQYTVCELDAQNQPMEEGTYYTSNGEEYQVHYNGYNIDNILKQEHIDVSVTKVWRGTPAEAVSFELYRAEGISGTPEPVLDASGQQVTLTLTAADRDPADGFWKGAFQGLDVYNEDRSAEYIYSVREAGVDNGTITLGPNTYEAEALEGNVFRNTIVDPNNGTYTASKIWAGEGYTAETGEPVTIQLYASGVPYGDPVVLSKDNGWTHTFTDLPLYDDYTYADIVYTAGELNADGTLIPDGGVISMNGGTERYTVTYSGGIVTNTLRDVDSYKYMVHRYYTYIHDGVTTTFVDDDTQWTAASRDEVISIDAQQWADCRVDERDITYRFEDTKTQVYQGTSSGHPFTLDEKTVSFVTEKFIDGESYYEVYLYYIFTYRSVDFVSAEVTKVWEDDGDAEGLRPDSVTVALMDGDRTVKTAVLSEANNWTVIWNYLDDSRSYTVEEVNVPEGYSSYVSGTYTGGIGYEFTVVNTMSAPEEPVVPIEEPQDPDLPPAIEVADGDTVELVEIEEEEVPLTDVPKTSDSSNIMLWLFMTLTSAAALLGSLAAGRRASRTCR